MLLSLLRRQERRQRIDFVFNKIVQRSEIITSVIIEHINVASETKLNVSKFVIMQKVKKNHFFRKKMSLSRALNNIMEKHPIRPILDSRMVRATEERASNPAHVTLR
jgi:hypothetical protein